MPTLTRRAEVVAEDEVVAGRFRDYLQNLDYAVRVRDAVAPTTADDVDLVIYHVSPEAMRSERRQTARPRDGAEGPPRSWLEALRQISERAPATQVLVAVAAGESTADRALDSGATDVIEATVTPGIFRRRIEMLEAFRRPAAPHLPPPLPPRTDRPRSHADTVLELPVPELRNDRSGRIDAQAVADYLGISLKRLADSVNVKYASLHKTPDSARAQDVLRPVVRVLELANRAFGNAEMVRRWLNRPLDELEDESPLAVILTGEADAVETLLRNALTGIPV
jgi:hypothetical protein